MISSRDLGRLRLEPVEPEFRWLPGIETSITHVSNAERAYVVFSAFRFFTFGGEVFRRQIMRGVAADAAEAETWFEVCRGEEVRS